MLKGGTEVLEEAGAVLIGGHSAEGAELALGFAVTGRTRPGRLLRKGGLLPGDRLVLTKPLGTGVILAAEMRGRATAQSFAAAVAAMRAIGRRGVVLPCRAWRDRLYRRDRFRPARAPRRDANRFGRGGAARPAAIPTLDGAHDLLASGLTSSLQAATPPPWRRSPRGCRCRSGFAALLIDPQTAGGLLAGMPAERAADCVAELAGLGYGAAAIGVVGGARGCPLISLEGGVPSDPGLATACCGRRMSDHGRDRRAGLPAVDRVLPRLRLPPDRAPRACARA